MPDNQSANFPLLVSRNVIGREVGEALKKFVGRGKDYSVKVLSNRSGVPDRLIEAAMCDPDTTEYRHLKTEMLVSICAVLGAGFTTEWLSLATQGAFALPDADDTPPGAIVADDAEDHAKLSDAARDGTFANDSATLKVVSTRMIERGMKLRSIAA